MRLSVSEEVDMPQSLLVDRALLAWPPASGIGMLEAWPFICKCLAEDHRFAENDPGGGRPGGRLVGALLLHVTLSKVGGYVSCAVTKVHP